MIADKELFELFEEMPADRAAIQADYIEKIITKSLAVKKAVVEQDEREAGPRQVLNFGHTIGHAIEGAGELEGMLHGEAIACGMLAVTKDEAIKARLQAVLEKLNLPTTYDYPAATLMDLISHDKKANGSKISLVQVKEIGKAEIAKLPVSALEKFL